MKSTLKYRIIGLLTVILIVGVAVEPAYSNQSLARSYLSSKDDFKRIFTQMQKEVRACVKREGFTYFVGSPPTDGAFEDGSTTDKLLEVNGYGIASLFDENVPVSSGSTAQDVYINSLSASDQTVYQAKISSCFESVLARLFKGTKLGDPKGRNEIERIDLKVMQDKRVIAATKKWSICLREAGFKAKDRKDLKLQLEIKARTALGGSVKRLPNGEIVFASGQVKKLDPDARKYQESEFRVLELAAAKADVQCARRHLRSIEAEVRNELIDALLA